MPPGRIEVGEDLAWRTVAEILPAIVYSASANGQIEYINGRFREYFGHPPTAILNDAWIHFVHPDDVDSTVERFGRAMASGELYRDEVRLRRISGDYEVFLSTAMPMRDSTGKIVRWFGIATNINDRIAVQAALEVSERNLQTFLETVPQIVWSADATGWIDGYNRRWYEYTGQTAAEAAGWGWQAAHHPEDFPRVMEAWPNSIATGEPFEMEFRLRGADGTFRWFLTRVLPQRDASGEIVRWFGSNTDIDQQKRLLQQSARISETLQDAFLPERLPVRDDMRFDAVYLPAESEAFVGGDWYDAFTLDDGRVIASVGDVAGHGVDAAVTAGRLRQAIVSAALDDAEPATILRKVNRVLRFQEETVASALVALIDPIAMTMTYASAGHPPPVIAAPGSRGRLEPYTTSPALGVLDDFCACSVVLQIARDTVAVLYTDGVTEFARDIERAEKSLIIVAEHYVGDVSTARPAVNIQRAVMGETAPADDAAVLFIQWSAIDRARLHFDATALQKKWRFHSSDAFTARTSRREIVKYLRQYASGDDDMFTAELIIGELLANTVEHAPGLVEVAIDWSGPSPELSVRDSGPGLRSIDAALPDEAFDEDGRGLFLISQFACDVRIEPAGFGTVLHVRLPLYR